MINSAANAVIGQYLNPADYREHYMNRTMGSNEGIYSFIHPWPGCGLGMNEFHFRLHKHGHEIIHTYYRGELIRISEVDFKWNTQNKSHDKVINIVHQTNKRLSECGNPAIFRLLRYLISTNSDTYRIIDEGAKSITLYKRQPKGRKQIFTISKWTGKLIGKNNRE